MTSPTISIESFIEPIQLTRPSTWEGGMTSAIGLPKRVTRIGFLVLQTCSRRDRHLALNSEMATSCIAILVVKEVYHSLNSWATKGKCSIGVIRRFPGGGIHDSSATKTPDCPNSVLRLTSYSCPRQKGASPPTYRIRD